MCQLAALAPKTTLLHCRCSSLEAPSSQVAQHQSACKQVLLECERVCDGLRVAKQQLQRHSDVKRSFSAQVHSLLARTRAAPAGPEAAATCNGAGVGSHMQWRGHTSVGSCLELCIEHATRCMTRHLRGAVHMLRARAAACVVAMRVNVRCTAYQHCWDGSQAEGCVQELAVCVISTLEIPHRLV